MEHESHGDTLGTVSNSLERELKELEMKDLSKPYRLQHWKDRLEY